MSLSKDLENLLAARYAVSNLVTTESSDELDYKGFEFRKYLNKEIKAVRALLAPTVPCGGCGSIGEAKYFINDHEWLCPDCKLVWTE
jgi:hypothetical protein